MKKIFLLVLLFVTGMNLSSQEKTYELINNMPVFYQEIKKSLTWPMAWGNSSVKDFKKWRTIARP